MRVQCTHIYVFSQRIEISIFSILGVQSDCSQEQIRKHYKKIAVLVHPDKNKQPGAEEAFKILQRAFELIGEPVKLLTLFINLIHTVKRIKKR